MIVSFKKEGWFARKRILFYMEHDNDFVFYDIKKIKKYSAGGHLDFNQVLRLRDFLSRALLKVGSFTDD